MKTICIIFLMSSSLFAAVITADQARSIANKNISAVDYSMKRIESAAKHGDSRIQISLSDEDNQLQYSEKLGWCSKLISFKKLGYRLFSFGENLTAEQSSACMGSCTGCEISWKKSK